jgi:hypothetical protein
VSIAGILRESIVERGREEEGGREKTKEREGGRESRIKRKCVCVRERGWGGGWVGGG